MSIKSKVKNEAVKRIKKLVIKAVMPFLPFIIIIVGLVFAICTVIDTLFTTDEDMDVAGKLYTDDYETQYAEWLQEKENAPNGIIDGRDIVPTRYVYMAYTWIHKNNFAFWYENSSYNRCLQIT